MAVKAEPVAPAQLSAIPQIPRAPVVKMEIKKDLSSEPMELDSPKRDQELPAEPMPCLSGFADDPINLFDRRGVYVKPNAFKCQGFDLSNIFDEFVNFQCGQQ